MHTTIWAHRGSSHQYIENTLAAFKQAIHDGSDGIELDVQRTKDGKLVVIHDENLKRLTGDTGFVWEKTWKELQQLSLKPSKIVSASNKSLDTAIPSLEAVLQLMKETHLTVNIELKNSIHFYTGMEEEVWACVQKFGMEDQALFSSFNHQSMHHMVSLAGADRCAILTSDVHYEPWNYAEAIGVKSIHPALNSLQQRNLVQTCHEKGLKVHVWTADEDAHIYAGLLLGVDAIITNVPKKAIALKKQIQEDSGAKALKSVQSLGLSLGE